MSRRRTQGIRTVGVCVLCGILLGIVSLAAGCATGRIVGDMYRDSENGFQVRLPSPPWQLRSLNGATLSFVSPEYRAGMALRVDCGRAGQGQLPWVARHLFFGLQDADIQGEDTMHLLDTTAVRTRLRARLDDQPVEVEGVSLRRTGCLYDFMYVAPPATFPRGRADFEAFVRSCTPLAQQ